MGKVPRPKDSGITDLDKSLKKKVRESRGSVPVEKAYTPITNLTDLGPAISAIKRGQDRTADAVDSLDRIVRREVKPKLDDVREGFIRLETEHKDTKHRVRALETDTREIQMAPAVAHDCYHEDEIRGLEEGHRSTMADVAVVKTDVATVQASQFNTKEALDKDVGRIDGRSKTVLGISVTVILFVLASVFAALGAFYTVQADVGHLSREQTKIRDEVSKMRESNAQSNSQVESAVQRVEKVVVQAERDESSNPLDRIWCDLSPQERWRQKKMRGAKKVPRRRCP